MADGLEYEFILEWVAFGLPPWLACQPASQPALESQQFYFNVASVATILNVANVTNVVNLANLANLANVAALIDSGINYVTCLTWLVIFLVLELSNWIQTHLLGLASSNEVNFIDQGRLAWRRFWTTVATLPACFHCWRGVVESCWTLCRPFVLWK